MQRARLLFALIIGVVFGSVLFYLYKTWIYIPIGFFAGVTGIITHLVGDMLSYMPFKPLWPFRETTISYGIFSADNQDANNAMIVLGIICFALYALTYKYYGVCYHSRAQLLYEFIKICFPLLYSETRIESPIDEELKILLSTFSLTPSTVIK